LMFDFFLLEDFVFPRVEAPSGLIVGIFNNSTIFFVLYILVMLLLKTQQY
jgi:hypothetical protein